MISWQISFLVITLGLFMGSFANVVIFRYLSNLSVVDPPRSFCPFCRSKIPWYDNIPVFSWIFLKGKCRFCENFISIQYPLIEGLTSVVFWLTYQKFGWTFSLLEYSIFFWLLIVMSVIDLKSCLLPDVFTLTGIFLGILGSLINPERDIVNSLLGVIFGGGFFWVLSYVYFLIKKQVGLGGGDIKLLAMIGAYQGWKSIFSIIFFASVIGGIAGLLAMRNSNKGFKTMIPFGPFLAVSSGINLFWGEKFIHMYHDFLLPF